MVRTYHLVAELEEGPTDDGKEDEKERPSHNHFKYLKGRVLSSYNLQDFEAGWIFQRAANRCMHLLSFFFWKGHVWYETQVEGGRIEQIIPGGFVIVCFAAISPLLFPIVFGLAVFALGPLCFISIPYIRSFKKKKKNVDSDQEEGRYSISSILVTLLVSGWYLIVSTIPWLYYRYGPYQCATDTQCGEIPVHISPLLVWQLIACCMVAGFRFIRAISISACDCACERQGLKLMNDPKYGPGLKDIIKKLADMKDKHSYFPIFVFGESSEPDEMKMSYMAAGRIWLFAMIHALTPHIWMKLHYGQPWLSLETDWFTFAVMFVGTIAPFLELRHFLVQFHEANEEFQDVIDELLIFVYICSPASGKSRVLLKNKYVQQVQTNDDWRRQHSQRIKNKEGFQEFTCLAENESRFKKTRDRTLSKETRASLKENMCEDELERLCEFQVALNFRRVEGIMLFRQMRKWLNIDILNERLEVEHFVTMSLELAFLGFLGLFIAYINSHEGQVLSCIWVMIPYDIVIVFVYILRALALCIAANEYLFDETEFLLVSWQEHCAQWDDPESYFEKGDEKGERERAIAWVWDEDKQAPKAVDFFSDLKESTDETGALKALDIMIKRISMLEQKQRIMGLEVTKQLRNRLAATLASGLVAILVKFPSILKQHGVTLAKVGKSLQENTNHPKVI